MCMHNLFHCRGKISHMEESTLETTLKCLFKKTLVGGSQTSYFILNNSEDGAIMHPGDEMGVIGFVCG